MKRGTKAKPAELAAMQGNPGHRPLATTPEQVPMLTERAPEWLKDKGARAVWASLMPMLRGLRFVKQTDHILVARYCRHLARWIDLNAKIDKRGDVAYTTDTNHGKMDRLHPHFTAYMRIEEALVKIEDRMGLSPAARQTLVQGFLRSPNDPPPAQLGAGRDAHDPTAPTSPLGLLANLHAQGNA